TPSRFVGESGSEPALYLLDGLALAARIAGNLIFAEPANREVARLRMRRVQPADAGGREHRGMLREGDPDRPGVQQIEQLELLAVVGTCGVSEPGSNPAVALGQNIVRTEPLVDAPFLARDGMEERGECFGEPIRQSLHEDRVVIVLRPLVAMGRFVGPE